MWKKYSKEYIWCRKNCSRNSGKSRRHSKKDIIFVNCSWKSGNWNRGNGIYSKYSDSWCHQLSYNKSNDKNATVQENAPAVEEVPVNADRSIDGVIEDTETFDAPEDENGGEKYADIPESVLPSSVRNDKDYFEFWDEPVKATCWIDGVKGTIYADWDMTQIIKEVTYDVDGYEDELLIIGSTLDGGTHAIAIYNGQYVVVNDAMWDHWYNGKSSAFD